MNDAPATCRMCGAPLNWHPGEATLVCPHCGTVNERTPSPSGPWGIEKAEIAAQDLAAALSADPPEAEIEETETVSCPGCGAEIVLEARTLADLCPFCATPLARAETHRLTHPKPQAVLPFAVGEREARAALSRWLGRLWFAPGDLARFARSDRPLEGVYLPFYTYDAEAEADYQGERGEQSMVRVGPRRGRPGRRRLRWRSVSGRVARRFADVAVPASERLGDRADDAALIGWDLQALHPYETRFLAGYRAELPGLALDAGWRAAQAKMEATLRDDAKRAIGGDEQRIRRLDVRYGNVTFRHVLLPVWLAAYRYRGRAYAVAVNARTGKVAGERPWSRWKVALALAAALVVALLLAWLFAGG